MSSNMMRMANACVWGVRDAASSLARATRAPRRDTRNQPVMPIFENGCYCCDLVTCVKIQGFVFTAGALLLAVLDVVLLAVLVGPREQNPGPNVDEYGRRFISNTKMWCVALFVCLLAWALICSLMLYGIYKRRRMLFWPYMVIAAINLLVTLGFLVFYASSVHSQFFNMMVLLILLALQFYFLLHVVSLFQKMGAEELAEAEAAPEPLQ